MSQQQPGADQQSAGPSYVVVLVRPSGPTNVGLAARACANIGIEALRIVAPLCDCSCKEARQFANKAGDWLQSPFADVAAAVADCDLVLASSARPRDPAYGKPLAAEHIPVWAQQQGARQVALLFGNEASGLSDDELRYAQAVWRLDTPGPYDNYNLSHAVAITLYALRSSTVPGSNLDNGPQATTPLPSAAERNALIQYWLGTLDRCGFFIKSDRVSWQPHFERLIRRLPLGQQDVRALRSGLAQINRYVFGDKADDMARTGRAPTPDAGQH